MNLQRLAAVSGRGCPLPALLARLLLPGAPGSLYGPLRRLLLLVGEEGVSWQRYIVRAACGSLGIAGIGRAMPRSQELPIVAN
jgi:hypothetical protein